MYLHITHKLSTLQGISCQGNSTVTPPNAVNQWLSVTKPVKGEVVKHYAMKTYREWRHSSAILDLGTHTPPTLAPGKQPPVPRLGGPQSQSGGCGQENNLLPLPGIEPVPSI
jgi:hypothetical protein